MLEVFRSRKMAALLLLGFSSGLPFYLSSRTLQAWMTVAGVNLTAIGLFSLASLPYSLKFLWSPLIDRFTFPFLGRRKGWLFVTQLALAAALATMAFQQPAEALELLAVNALLIAFLSATQDITIDAYRADILEPPEMGAGAGVAVLGFRIALIVTGAGALILADRLSWPVVYLLLAGLMLATIVVTTFVREPVLRDRPPSSVNEAVRMPFIDFFARMGLSRGMVILVFIVLYRLGDTMIDNMKTTFLLQTGFSQTDIGVIQGAMGLTTTIAGILAGGAVLSRIGINRSLWVFGALQAASNFGYLLLANFGRSYPLMILAVNIENFCWGLANTALVAFLTSLCDQRYSATQYALLSSLLAAGRDVLVAPAGSLAQVTGWPLFFWISIAAAIPGMMLLPIFAPWKTERRLKPATTLDGPP
jgi:MFS transporter, PAT family, beta-lactamase induction signal transducer AmpG